jgi:hypothetical protein
MMVIVSIKCQRDNTEKKIEHKTDLPSEKLQTEENGVTSLKAERRRASRCQIAEEHRDSELHFFRKILQSYSSNHLVTLICFLPTK